MDAEAFLSFAKRKLCFALYIWSPKSSTLDPEKENISFNFQ